MGKHQLSNKKHSLPRTIIRENRLLLFGALAMLAWTLWEGAVRLEAVDGITKAYFALVKEGDITLGRALENLWNTPEARRDLLSFVYLALTAMFSVFCLLMRRHWKAGLAILPLCALVLSYRPATNPLLHALNLFELIKDVSVAAVALDAAANIVSPLLERRKQRSIEAASGKGRPKALTDSAQGRASKASAGKERLRASTENAQGRAYRAASGKERLRASTENAQGRASKAASGKERLRASTENAQRRASKAASGKERLRASTENAQGRASKAASGKERLRASTETAQGRAYRAASGKGTPRALPEKSGQRHSDRFGSPRTHVPRRR